MIFKFLAPVLGYAIPAGAFVFTLAQFTAGADQQGVIAVVSTVAAATLYIGKKINILNSTFQTWGIEHEMLVRDFCERKGLDVSDLPTRAAQQQAKARGAGGIL